jgi:ABC-2 type transport system permease protein
MFSIVVQAVLFHVPFRGSWLEVLVLSFVFTACVAAFSITVSLFVRDEMFASIVNAVVFIPSTVFVGYTWPVSAMPGPYRVIANLHPFYHYAGNIRDSFLKGSIGWIKPALAKLEGRAWDWQLPNIS